MNSFTDNAMKILESFPVMSLYIHQCIYTIICLRVSGKEIPYPVTVSKKAVQLILKQLIGHDLCFCASVSRIKNADSFTKPPVKLVFSGVDHVKDISRGIKLVQKGLI